MVKEKLNKDTFGQNLFFEVGYNCFVRGSRICCGSVGRAVASDTRALQFESSHRQKLHMQAIGLENQNNAKRVRE